MIDTVIWYTPSQGPGLALAAPFLDLGTAVFEGPDTSWPQGWYRLEQPLDENQFNLADQLADQHVCIDCKRGPYPPGSPTGR
jgi:hypothetical protein